MQKNAIRLISIIFVNNAISYIAFFLQNMMDIPNLQFRRKLISKS